MICHIMVQSLFLGQTRLGVILISTDAIAYWQIRAINLDERHESSVWFQPIRILSVRERRAPSTQEKEKPQRLA